MQENVLLKNPKDVRSVKVTALIIAKLCHSFQFDINVIGILLLNRLSISGALDLLIFGCMPTINQDSTVPQKLFWAVLTAAQPICGPLVNNENHIFLCIVYFSLELGKRLHFSRIIYRPTNFLRR